MLYHSPEHKLLRLLWKIDQRVVGVYERFVTDDVFDPEKAKDVFAERGISRTRLQTAVQTLVGARLANAQGITQAGRDKIAQMETSRRTRITELGLTEDLGSTSVYDETKITELNATDL